MSKIDQAIGLLNSIKALDAVGRLSRAEGSITIETKPRGRISVGRARVDVPDAVAVRFGEAIGTVFVNVIKDMTAEAGKLMAEQETEPPKPSE